MLARLQLDENTLKDLEVFSVDDEQQSLFKLCNLARTNGGEHALYRRMREPWSRKSDIKSTQVSLQFIRTQRALFDAMPSPHTSNVIDRHYLNEILPLITDTNPVAFAWGVFGMWTNRDSHYFRIVRGVKMCCNWITALRDFLGPPQLLDAEGELAELLTEMRELLERPLLQEVTNTSPGPLIWRRLRFDQIFRLLEASTLHRLNAIFAELDALVAMSDASERLGFVYPEIADGPLRIEAEGLYHPFLAKAVANPIHLSQAQRTLFLTGPNMAGKTTYLRSTAVALLMAQMGMGVPAKRFRFAPAQHLYSSVSLSDDLSGGVSYFKAEALRVKAVATAVSRGDAVFALMDEPFKGTNVRDALEASATIISALTAKRGCIFVFSSHLLELGEQLSANSQVSCYCFSAEESAGQLRFDYQLREGISDQRLGMRVLEEEGIFDLLGLS